MLVWLAASSGGAGVFDAFSELVSSLNLEVWSQKIESHSVILNLLRASLGCLIDTLSLSFYQQIWCAEKIGWLGGWLLIRLANSVMHFRENATISYASHTHRTLSHKSSASTAIAAKCERSTPFQPNAITCQWIVVLVTSIEALNVITCD